jgi:hypothetical protein
MNALLHWDAVGAEERVAVLGLPTALQTTDYAPGYVGAGGLVATTVIQSDVANANDESGEHGFYIFYKRMQDPYSDRKDRIEPKGISGGPVLAFERRPTQLIGLVRSTIDGRHLWCEPIRFAIELLLDHPDESVANDARGALERLTATDASLSPPEPASVR